MSSRVALLIVAITLIQGAISQSSEVSLMLLFPNGRGSTRRFNIRDRLPQFATKVQQYTGFKQDSTHFLFNGKPLQNDKTLADQGVQQGSLITLLAREPNKIYISFVVPGESAVQRRNVRLSAKLGEVKKSLPAHLQKSQLIANGKPLQEDKTIQELKIREFDQITIRRTL